MRAYDLTVTGSLTVSGSTTLTGDITYDDLTATGNIVTTGANKVISGSSTSTGSFGRIVEASGLVIDNGAIFAPGNVSGSATSTGSFGWLEVAGVVNASGNVRGSRFEIDGATEYIDTSLGNLFIVTTGDIAAQPGTGKALKVTGGIEATSHITASKNIISTGANALISGSSTSTGSFGLVHTAGRVGIGTTTPGYNLEVAGTFYSGGSSIDYKKHVTDLDVDSSLIHSLRPVSYNYKKEYKDFGYNVKDGKQIGLVSEEVAKTIPELAIMKDGKPKNVDYQKLAVVLLAEVQSLKKDIEELKKDN